MSDYLMVPIHIEALFLPATTRVSEASADFTRIPYCNGIRDFNPNTAYLSEDIASIPFQDQNLYLKAGLHLHWFLPSALTTGRVDLTNSTTTFPAVPNRWLITRVNGSEQTQWVVESDYLHPEGEGEGCVVFPVTTPGTAAPTRRLGRAVRLDEWLQQANVTSAAALDPITAVGYGNPMFAAFYPNCHSVFGFCDEDNQDAFAGGREYYTVLGWYSDPEKNDFLRKYRQEKGLQGGKELLDALKRDFDWDLPAGAEDNDLQRMLCYGVVSGPVEDFQAGNPKIAVANSGVEGLSAYLADELAPGDDPNKATIEDQLEFLSIQPKLENNRLDLDAKFAENRHEREFNVVHGGAHWIVRLKLPSDAASKPDGQQPKVELSPEIAQGLNELNRQQRAYDRAMQVITDIRRLLFSDWYKYMLCAYPPEGAPEDYPDIDEVRYFIETHDLNILNEKVRPVDQQLRDLEATRTALDQLITQHNQKEGADQYILQSISAARYWQPKEPVVLIADGPASALVASEEASQACHIASKTGSEAHMTGEDLAAIQARIPVPPPAGERHPWHSIFLEWRVAFYPVQEGNNVFPTNGDYRPTYITGNFELKEGAVDLQRIQGKPLLKGAQIYSGSSILTPYAGIELGQKITAYLRILNDRKRLLGYLGETDEPRFDDWYNSRSAYTDGQPGDDAAFPGWLTTNIAGLIRWYAKRPPSTDPGPDPIETFLRAFATMQNKVFLSQALSGFNDALLMHKQTMQLPIADPLGFEAYQDFAVQVKVLIGGENKSAPQPLNDFNPIRTGSMSILHLRLVDTFGRVSDDLNAGRQMVTTELMRDPEYGYDRVMLPPRLVQPARLNFRWLAAESEPTQHRETNAHPATHPICGWLVPNNLDNSIMVYDQAGAACGAIMAEQTPHWQPAPGPRPKTIDDIANPHLRNVIGYLCGPERGSKFLDDYISVLDNALENIAPDNFRQHIGLALLMGRPVAVVRASLQLDVLGQPAVHQGWNVFRQDLGRDTRDSNAFTDVLFPIRLGEETQLNDGLIGYWLEEQGTLQGPFYAPQANDKVEDNDIRTHQPGAPLNVELSADNSSDAPTIRTFTMLLDPRGKVHATSGIVPVKAIDIPLEQYADTLKHLAVTFLAAPILTNQNKAGSSPPDENIINVPVPAEPGYDWTWLENQGDTWLEKNIHLPNPREEFSAPQEIREGWLELTPAAAPTGGNSENQGAQA